MRKIMLMALTIILAASVIPTLAGAVATGGLRINPHSSGYPSPIMLTSPATFTINRTQGAPNSYYPQILLVMSNDSYYGLTGNVVVEWATGTVSFAPGDFTGDNTNGDKVPATGTTSGADYTVASLKSHLAVGDTIWSAYKPFLSGPITATPTQFNITLPSTHPRMLVYALGKSTNCATAPFDMKVPNTQPGLVVPEPGPLLLAIGSFGAFGFYALKRRKR